MRKSWTASRFLGLSLAGMSGLAVCGGGAPGAAAGGDWILGRWDVTVEDPRGSYPSWFEIARRDGRLEGRLVGRVGSARPITAIDLDGETFSFHLPPQYERQRTDLVFEGRRQGDAIRGRTHTEDGRVVEFSAVAAPSLERESTPRWGEPIDLLAGGRDAWELRNPRGPDGWTLEDGVLTNAPPSVDILTRRKFTDFKLSLEFNMPEESNSGVYLRGRYEVQVQDDHGKEPESLRCGGIYGFIAPTRMGARPAGEWNSYQITLIGRRVTLVFNGETVIDDAEIPGITGGALESREGEPGPLMLQGDHRAVRYRNVVLTPALP